MKKPKRARWYMHYVGECPVCGRDKSYREARYTKPPAKRLRYKVLPPFLTYDYCDV